MALPNKPKGELLAVVDPEVVEMEVDALIIGGGRRPDSAASTCSGVNSGPSNGRFSGDL